MKTLSLVLFIYVISISSDISRGDYKKFKRDYKKISTLYYEKDFLRVVHFGEAVLKTYEFVLDNPDSKYFKKLRPLYDSLEYFFDISLKLAKLEEHVSQFFKYFDLYENEIEPSEKGMKAKMAMTLANKIKLIISKEKLTEIKKDKALSYIAGKIEFVFNVAIDDLRSHLFKYFKEIESLDLLLKEKEYFSYLTPAQRQNLKSIHKSLIEDKTYDIVASYDIVKIKAFKNAFSDIVDTSAINEEISDLILDEYLSAKRSKKYRKY